MAAARSPQHRALGRVVRSLREDREWSQWELAERARVSNNYVGMLERGEVDPSFSKLNQFARAFGVAASDLLARAEATRTRRTA